ncbi:MAG: alpha/beta hydrolase [Desulfobacterales bacterium]|jgi:pimeloyl-ACP methyl ester carboxylesterase
MMLMTIQMVVVLLSAYALLTLALTYLVQKYPRNPVVDPPDWGSREDLRLKTAQGGTIEVWRVVPEGPSCGTLLFMHGWGRNRDRMVGRARIFARFGLTTVMLSARDHGDSSPSPMMNIMKFAEDIETVLDWLKEPVLLYGHSAGSGAALIAAVRNPGRIKLLFLEAAFADTREALRHLYTWASPFFGRACGPMILFWMNLFYRGRLRRVTPCRLAGEIEVPVMLIHGEKDRRFPLRFAHRLQKCFIRTPAILYVAPGARHSTSATTPGYASAVRRFLEQHQILSPATKPSNPED